MTAATSGSQFQFSRHALAFAASSRTSGRILLSGTIQKSSCLEMTAEERARAVVAYFPAIPAAVRGQVEAVVTRAITRALVQQLAELEREALLDSRRSEGRGKQAKGRDPSAIHFHKVWAERFRERRLRLGSGTKSPPASTAVASVESKRREKPLLLRSRQARSGDVVVVHRCEGAYSDLPDGLPDGARVTFLDCNHGAVTVRDAAEKSFTVALPQIEMPTEIWWKGQWVDYRTHPEGEEAYRWAMAQPYGRKTPETK